MAQNIRRPTSLRIGTKMKHYDVIIIGAGPGGIFAAYELVKNNAQARIACFEKGAELANRRCPIDGKKIKSCIHCPVCSIMSGFGGAGAFSDGKYNITNEFGGNLYEYIGRDEATELMKYVDEINMSHGGEGTRLYSTADTAIKKKCFEHDLKLLGAQVRHLGTDKNYVVLQNLYDEMKEKVDFYFRSNVDKVYDVSNMSEDLPPVTDAKARYVIEVEAPGSEGSPEEHAAEFFSAEELIISIGRSGSKWMETVCDDLGLEKKSNRVDIGIRVELPHEVFSELTDELYESKIVYRTKQYNDLVRTFCMNPHGVVVNENTNGIVTVNGHSYEDPAMHTENTNFALLVTKHFTEPFKESNDYGESIARLSNMLGGGVIVQRFGDLISGRRTNESRLEGSFVRPTLAATPGDLSLVIPKRIMDDIIEMVYALDKIAPGTANQDTLLYGVEVKFYNMEVKMGKDLDTGHPGLYVIGDGSGVTHSLSHASASGVFVARRILGK